MYKAGYFYLIVEIIYNMFNSFTYIIVLNSYNKSFNNFDI